MAGHPIWGPCEFCHDDVINWKHFPRYWPFLRGIPWSPVNFPHKSQWHGALMFCLICVWINGWVNNREAGELRRHHAHYDVTVMVIPPRRVNIFFLKHMIHTAIFCQLRVYHNYQNTMSPANQVWTGEQWKLSAHFSILHSNTYCNKSYQGYWK